MAFHLELMLLILTGLVDYNFVYFSEPPFHLTRRGWGEFPVRVQLHFKDERKKRLDVIHNLKLDRTYTGLQTLGAETVSNKLWLTGCT